MKTFVVASIFVVLLLLVAAVAYQIVQYESTQVSLPMVVAGNCHAIVGGRVCYESGYWVPHCMWPYREVFPFKTCRI